MIIDAHQHFWDLARGDYAWLTPDAGVLYRDYLPHDLAGTLREHGVGATVLVQAAASEAETQFLFRLAAAHPFVAGVVGWVDFESHIAPQRISSMAAAAGGRLKGMRPMIHDIADAAWVTRPALDAAFEAMTAKRPYRMTPLTNEQALAELRKFAGIQFDPVMVDAFVP